MNSRKSAFLASVLVCLCFCGPLVRPVSANVYLTNGEVHLGQQPGGGTSPNVNRANYGDGWFFNNAIDSLNPLDPGTFTIRTVGAAQLTGRYVQSPSSGAGPFTNYDNADMVLVYAAEGLSALDPDVNKPLGSRIFTAMAGRVALFKAGANFFSPDPLSWGVVDGSLDLVSPIAVWDLYPATNIVLGPNGSSLSILQGPEADVNVIEVSTLSGIQANGRFLTVETTTYNGPAELSGNDFWNSYSPGNITEHLVFGISETLNTGSDEFRYVNPLGPNGTSGLTVLNEIATTLGGLGNFATGWGTGSASDFAPFGAPNTFGNATWGQNTPDNIFNSSSHLGFGVQPIPEPGSIAIFALILGGAGAVAGWRRRRARVASQA